MHCKLQLQQALQPVVQLQRSRQYLVALAPVVVQVAVMVHWLPVIDVGTEYCIQIEIAPAKGAFFIGSIYPTDKVL
jgi:hypothetical protein